MVLFALSKTHSFSSEETPNAFREDEAVIKVCTAPCQWCLAVMDSEEGKSEGSLPGRMTLCRANILSWVKPWLLGAGKDSEHERC